jgi:hypothetical protein
MLMDCVENGVYNSHKLPTSHLEQIVMTLVGYLLDKPSRIGYQHIVLNIRI